MPFLCSGIYNVYLNEPESEGLSNLASQLIYENYNNSFSIILNNNLVNNNHHIYGKGYRKMNKMKNQIGWHGLIKKIIENYSY